MSTAIGYHSEQIDLLVCVYIYMYTHVYSLYMYLYIYTCRDCCYVDVILCLLLSACHRVGQGQNSGTFQSYFQIMVVYIYIDIVYTFVMSDVYVCAQSPLYDLRSEASHD